MSENLSSRNDGVRDLVIKGSLSPAQLGIVEVLAHNPNMTYGACAEKLGIHRETVSRAMSDPSVLDAFYQRYMQIAHRQLPAVTMAMIREAKGGNVSAARLVLEQFGKLEKHMRITIESPFEKFLQSQGTEIANDEDYTIIPAEIIQDIEEQVEADGCGEINLPPRDEINNSPKTRVKLEREKLEYSTRQAEYHTLRARAKAVGKSPMPRGKPAPGARDKWIRELQRLEIEKFGKIQYD